MTNPPKPPPQRAPTGLGRGGRALWRAVTAVHTLDGVQLAQLTEACRQKDRLDKLDLVLTGDAHTWMDLAPLDVDGRILELRITGALSKANETANTMKQLLAALRLPDDTGARPQQRGGGRGAYGKPQQAGAGTGKVSSMERHRQRAEAQTGT